MTRDRRPDRLLRIVMAWTVLTFVLAWLPLVRCLFDGSSYEWGTRVFGARLGGAGLEGDLWFLVLETAFGIWLLHQGWRRRGPAFRVGLVGWHAFLAAQAVYAVATAPEAFRFEGATLGVEVSLALLAPVLTLGFLALAVVWAVRHRGRPAVAPPPWTRLNTFLTVAVVLLFPVQFVLLRTGRGQEATDQIGVLLTIGQWLLLAAALYPWRPRRRGEREVRASA